MATYTAKLNLKKPTTDEMYNVLDWNDNSDKIEAGFNKLMTAEDLGTITTLSDLQSALSTKVASMSQNDVLPVEFYVGTTAFETFNAYERYVGMLKCTYVATGRRDLAITFESGSSEMISIGRFNGSWRYNDRASARSPAISSISSDTEILSYENGAYQVALSAASSYLPTQYGTLLINFSGSAYGAALYISSAGNMYFRHKKSSSEWHNTWTRLSNAN